MEIIYNYQQSYILKDTMDYSISCNLFRLGTYGKPKTNLSSHTGDLNIICAN